MKNFSIIIFICCFLNISFLAAQSVWNKITDDHAFRFDNVDMNQDGDIVLSVANKLMLVEIKDRGTKINKIQISGYVWLPTFFEKTVFYENNRDLVFYFSYGSGVNKISRQNNSLEKVVNIRPQMYTYKEDALKNKIVNNYDAIIKYDSAWNFIAELYKSNKYIINNYFLFSEEKNYIGATLNSYLSAIIKFNSNSNITQIDTVPLSFGIDNFVITSSGKVITSFKGLNSYENKKITKINYRDSSEFKIIHFINYGKDGNIYLRSENDFYYSNDEGLTWQRLFHFNRNLPQGVTKFVAFDTSFAAALINNNAINDEFYIIRSGENEWQKVDLDINTREFSVLQYSKKKNLFGSDDQWNSTGHKMLKSSDEGKTWDILKYKNNNIVYCGIINDVLYGVALDSLGRTIGIRSNDEGKSWTEVKLPGFVDSKFHVFYFQNVNNKIIAAIGRQDGNLEPFDDVNFYISEDDGTTWKFLYTSNRRTDQRTAIAIDLHNNMYFYKSSRDSLLLSKDYGKNKELDNRFTLFSSIYGLYFNPDGSAFIAASLSKGPVRLYKTNDYINFKELDCPYNKGNISGLVLNIQLYPTILASDIYKGVWISKDGGQSWQEYNDGLKYMPEVFSYFKNSIFLDDRRAILSIDYDGLYKTSWPVSNEDVAKQNVERIFFPNPAKDHLFLAKESLDFPIQLLVKNVNGQLLKSVILDDIKSYISIEEFPAGILVLELLQKDKIIHREKVIKL